MLANHNRACQAPAAVNRRSCCVDSRHSGGVPSAAKAAELNPLNVIHRPMESSQKKIGTSAIAARHEPRSVQYVAEQQRVQARDETGSEDGGVVTDLDQRLADRRRRTGANSLL